MSTLGAVLQGMDRGVTNGLNLYKTVQDEARMKREEQYRDKRAARQDMEADRTWENNLSRQRVEDEQWGKTHAENVRKTDADIAYNKGTLAVAQQNARTTAGRLSLDQQRQQYVMDDDRRARALETHRSRVIAASYGPDGNLLTGQALRDNLNRTGAIADLAQIKALETGIELGNYTGLQAVSGPDGRSAIQVAGKDRTGKPIEGQAFMSERGTSDPDDPYVAFDLDTEVARINPALRDAQRSNALARDLSASVSADYDNTTQAALGDWGKQIDSVTSDIRAREAKLAELQAERAKLPEHVSRPVLAGGIGGGAGIPRTNPQAAELDAKIASLSSVLRDQEQKVGVFMQRAQEVTPFYDKAKANVLSGIATDHRMQGENYYANQQALSAGAPKAQALRLAESEKSFEAFRKEVPGQVTKAPNAKGEGGTKGTVNQINIMLETLSPETRRRIGGDPRYRALARDLLDKAGRTGITGDLEMMMEAAEAGANMDVYMEQMNSPQLMEQSLAEREQFALEVARRAAAHPDKSSDTIAGELIREMSAR